MRGRSDSAYRAPAGSAAHGRPHRPLRRHRPGRSPSSPAPLLRPPPRNGRSPRPEPTADDGPGHGHRRPRPSPVRVYVARERSRSPARAARPAPAPALPLGDPMGWVHGAPPWAGHPRPAAGRGADRRPARVPVPEAADLRRLHAAPLPASGVGVRVARNPPAAADHRLWMPSDRSACRGRPPHSPHRRHVRRSADRCRRLRSPGPLPAGDVFGGSAARPESGPAAGTVRGRPSRRFPAPRSFWNAGRATGPLAVVGPLPDGPILRWPDLTPRTAVPASRPARGR